MKLSFGNMTIELNIFNVCKQMRDDDNDFEEVVFVGTIVQETLIDSSDSNLLEIMFRPRREVVDNFMDDPIFHISKSDNLESLESCIAHFLVSNDPSLWGITNAFIEPTMKGQLGKIKESGFLQALKSHPVESCVASFHNSDNVIANTFSAHMLNNTEKIYSMVLSARVGHGPPHSNMTHLPLINDSCL